ncbi:phage tail fiber domain-containing protein, partial [Ectopseudomonas alcaliphila]
MAVPQQQPFVEYASNGIATVFAIPFRLIRDDDLGVYLDGVELTSGFVISNVGSDIGQISFAVAPPSGVLALRREVPLERSTDYQDNGDLLAETINLDFDRLWCALQDMNYDLRRALLREALSDFYDANGLQIKNLADPTEDTDVANKRWVSQFLATLIGGLVIGPVGAAAAVTYTAPDGQLNTVQDMSDARGSSLIGYSADGGVARTVEAKLREIASRADYASDANFLAAAVGKPSIDAAGNLDAPIKKTNGDVITLQELASQEPPTVNVSPSISTSPAYIDQFIDGFFARGMLTTETNGVVTERSITASASAGGNVISIGSNTNLVVGGGVTVLHEDGTYWPYLITALTSSSVTVFPALRAAVNTSGKIERTWFNRAHPGKFYMRYLAQRVARNTEAQSTFPIGRRVAFVEYGSGTTTALGGLSTTTGATLNYYDPLPTGASGTVSTAPRFTFERTAYVDFTSSSTGYAQTGLFALREYLSSAAVFSIASDRPIRITVLDNSGRTLASTVYSPLFIASANMAHRRVRLNFFSANATSVRFRFEAATTSASAVAIGSIEVYQTSQSNGLI